MKRKFTMKHRSAAIAVVFGTLGIIPILSGAADTNKDMINDQGKTVAEQKKAIDEHGNSIKRIDREILKTNSEMDENFNAVKNDLLSLQRELSQISDNISKKTQDTGAALHGFADVGWGNANKNYGPEQPDGFTFGNMDLFLAPHFDNVKALLELVVEHDDAGDIAVDLERIQVGYLFSDQLTLWFGRFHTPYGYWNTAFHHGAQLQTSILRPKFIDFEDKGGILPAHMTGMWATGQAGSGDGKLHYDVYVTNGNKISDGVLNMNQARDDNGNPAAGFNIAYVYRRAFTLGLHGFTQEIDAYDAASVKTSRTTVNMAGLYAYLSNNDWEGITEYYLFNNKDLDGGMSSHTSSAAFLQIGRTLNSNLTPYYRFEQSDLSQTDNYFAAQTSGRSYTRHALGIRFDVNAKAAIKLEANSTDQDTAAATSVKYNEVRTQFAIAF